MAATSASAVATGDTARQTEVYIPPLVRGAVSVSGAARLTTVVDNPDGSRLALVAPTGRGAYGVSVG
jgi:hypothetical protein